MSTNGILSVERRNVSVKHTFANLIGTSASNVVVMYNQNVGIGTTMPRSKLDITGNIMFDGTLMDGNSNAIWIPGSTLYYATPVVPQSLNWASGYFVATTSNYTHKYVGKEVGININYSGTVVSPASNDVRISVPYPVDTSIYTTDTIVGQLGISVIAGAASNYYPGYFRTSLSDANSLVIRLVSGSTDLALSMFGAGTQVTLQGNAVFATAQVANYNGVPIVAATGGNFIYNQVSDISFGSGQAPTRGKFEIVTTSNLPGLVVDQRGTGNLAQFMYNAAPLLTIGRDGLFYNSNNVASWIPGSSMQWIAAPSGPTLGLPGTGGSLTNITATAGYRFVGTEVVYNFLTSNVVTTAPTLDTGASNYTLSLPYALDATKYNSVAGTVIGDLWVTMTNATGTVTTTYPGYALTVPGSVNIANIRYLNGTRDSTLADFASGSRFTLQGTLTYNSSVYANNTPLAPTVVPASFIQDAAGRVSFNYPGGTNPAPARFDITDDTPSAAFSVNQTSNGLIMNLKSSNAQKLVFDATGRLGIGTTSPSNILQVDGTARVASLGVGVNASGNTGEILATGDITVYYSDARLKANIRDIDGALDKLAGIRGVYYTQNEVAERFGYSNYAVQVGVLAQEVQTVLPEVVTIAPFDRAADAPSASGESYLTVKYDRLVPLLINAVKELAAEIKELKAAGA